MIEYGIAAGGVSSGGRSFGGPDFSAWTSAVMDNPAILVVAVALSVLLIRLAFFR